MPGVSVGTFLREYSNALRKSDAALFVGAGMSRAAGFVDWKGLLKEIAEELGLDIDKETDLVAVAQYHQNHRGGRHRLNQLILDEFLEDVELTINHDLIAALPIHSIWTTNYDELLETAFKHSHKRVDVKVTNEDFAVTLRRSDATIYKMHGDAKSPDTAVLTKEDYESYNASRELFTIALKGDLARKTFLFLGFSFSDPNVGYILSRVKQLLEKNNRDHYCILKQPDPKIDGDYECNRFRHWLDDLRRYNIQPVLIDGYDEIPKLLAELNRRSHIRDVFISGSAHDFSPMGEDPFKELCRLLGEQLIKQKCNVVSGFGLGVGDMVIVGAMSVLKRNDDERLQLWPFPQQVPTGTDRAEFWTDYRRRMLSEAGVCVVVAGNKVDGGSVVPANGVREEVKIAREQGKLIIPIGATGHVAEEIWQDAQADPKLYYGEIDLAPELKTLGDSSASPAQLVECVIQMIKKLESKGA